MGEVLRPALRWWLARHDAGSPDPAPQPVEQQQVGTVAVATRTDPEPGGPASPPAAALSRRVFVAAAAALGIVGYGTYSVMRGPQLKRLTIALAKLPRAAHGFRIAVVSDIHLGPILGRGFSQRVVDTINSAQSDLIAVVGDLVDGSVADLSDAVEPLAHQPVVIDDAVTHGVDLQLSGHTHGGQMWPGPLLAGLANPTVAGLDRYGDTQLYVTLRHHHRGTRLPAGVSLHPWRVPR